MRQKFYCRLPRQGLVVNSSFEIANRATNQDLLFFMLSSGISVIAQSDNITSGRNAAKGTGLSYDPALIPFYHGVASGDPTTTSVILWTRVTPATTGIASITGTYEVATDTGFTTVYRI